MFNAIQFMYKLSKLKAVMQNIFLKETYYFKYCNDCPKMQILEEKYFEYIL